MDPDGRIFTPVGALIAPGIVNKLKTMFDLPKLGIPGWLANGLLWGDVTVAGALLSGQTGLILAAWYLLGFIGGAGGER